jgi:hypothetical protein
MTLLMTLAMWARGCICRPVAGAQEAGAKLQLPRLPPACRQARRGLKSAARFAGCWAGPLVRTRAPQASVSFDPSQQGERPGPARFAAALHSHMCDFDGATVAITGLAPKLCGLRSALPRDPHRADLTSDLTKSRKTDEEQQCRRCIRAPKLRWIPESERLLRSSMLAFTKD